MPDESQVKTAVKASQIPEARSQTKDAFQTVEVAMLIKKWFASKSWAWAVFILGALLISPISGCTFFRGQEGGIGLNGIGKQGGTVTSESVTEFVSKVRPYREDVDSIYRRARYFHENRKYRIALQEYHAVVRADPNHVQAYNGMGICYDLLRDYERAVYCYKKALAINPDLAYVQNNLGYSYFLQGKLDAAIQAFKKAIELDTQEAMYHNNLGLAYAEKGLSRPAFEQFALSGSETKAHRNLAQIYLRKGLDEEAQKQLAQAKRATTPLPSRDFVNPKFAASAEPYRHKSGGTVSVFASSGGSEGDRENGFGIEVSNGNGVRFMARDVSRYLAKRGYEVQRLSNARPFSHEKTIIYYQDNCLEHAYRIAKELPGWNDLRKVGGGITPNIKIRLVLGKDLIPFRKIFRNV